MKRLARLMGLVALAGILGLSPAFEGAPGPRAPGDPRTPILAISDPSNYAGDPALVGNGALGFVALWIEERRGSPVQSTSIWHTRISLDGERFTQPEMLLRGELTPPEPSPVISSAGQLRACSDGRGNIYAAWAQLWLYFGENPFFPIEVSEVYLAASHDGGHTYSAPAKLSEGVRGVVPAVACHPGGQVVVGFYDSADADRGFWYRISTDFGDTFGPRARLPRSGEMATEAVGADLLLLEDGSLAAAWEAQSPGDFDFEVFAAQSGDLGATWTQPVNLSQDPADSLRPAIAAVADGSILVAWDDSREAYFHVFGRLFDPVKQDWSDKVWRLSWEDSVDPPFTETALGPALAVDRHGDFWITWVDGFHRFEPSYRVSSAAGNAELVPRKIREAAGDRVLDGYRGTSSSRVASAAGGAVGIAWDACPQLYCASDPSRVYVRLLQRASPPRNGDAGR